MATHFNAFISYRHSALDSQIAQRIHRQLERFKIPKAIQKVTGIKKIDRIFRDKEELPLSVNLSDDINEALVNSDYLIVICSPRFQQSQWCMREIELFLQTHPIERILIVLAEGEPDDVVPPILTQNREPLCCDYRMKPGKAKRIELPRLASALLGCRYDDLRQRQRQYRMRRLIALFSSALVASLCLTAYFINTSIQIQKANDDLSAANEQIRQANVQIQENLDQALRNQSQFLASASTERMEAGDRLTAIALALEALPGEGNDRPYIAEAEHALNDALSAYQSNQIVSAEGSFTADTLVKAFCVSQDGMTLYLLDTRGIVTVWDTVTFRKLYTLDLSTYSLESMYVTPRGDLLFVTSGMEETALCYSKDGTLLWQIPHCKDVAFLDDFTTVMVLQYDYKETQQILYVDPVTGEQRANAFDLKTGTPENTAVVGFLQEEYISGQTYTLEYLDGTVHYVVIANAENGQFVTLMTADSSLSGESQFLDSVCLAPNGDILVMRGDSSGMYNGNYQTYEITSPDRADILCFDAVKHQVKWTGQIINYVYGGSMIKPIPGSDRILCLSGNHFQVYDIATGECVAQCQTPAIPLEVKVEEDATWGILENGTYFQFSYEKNQCSTEVFLDGTIDKAAANKGYFVHVPLSSQVTVYRAVADKGSTQIDCQDKLSPRVRLLCEDKLAVWDSSSVYMLDLGERNLVWKHELGFGHKVLGFSQDGKRFLMWNKLEEKTLTLDVQTGQQQEAVIDLEIPGQYSFLESDVFFDRDQMLVCLESDGHYQLRKVDPATGKQILTLDIPDFAPEKTDYSCNTQILAATDELVWLWKDKKDIITVDLNTAKTHVILEEVTTHPVCAMTPGRDEFLLAVGNELILFSNRAERKLTIALEEKKGISVCFYGSELLALCDDGVLYRYDRSGSLLSRTVLELYNTFASNALYPIEDPQDVFWCFTSDGELILNAFDAGNIITCDSWQAKVFVPNLCAYVKESDEIICLSRQQLYAYPRYTMEEQIEKAKQALGNFSLTQEQRKFYGLS